MRKGYIAIYASGGHLNGSLEKACNQTKNQRARHSATKEAAPYISHLAGSKKSSNEMGNPHTEVGRPAGGALCES